MKREQGLYSETSEGNQLPRATQPGQGVGLKRCWPTRCERLARALRSPEQKPFSRSHQVPCGPAVAPIRWLHTRAPSVFLLVGRSLASGGPKRIFSSLCLVTLHGGDNSWSGGWPWELEAQGQHCSPPLSNQCRRRNSLLTWVWEEVA